MARFRTVLTAVARAASRGSKSLRNISGNNMFYAGTALAYMMDPAALGLFLVLIAIVIFLPSSSDPLTSVPPDRLALWPLSKYERLALRLLSPLLNPLAWILLAGMLWKRLTWGLWGFVASAFLAGFLGSSAFRAPHVWGPRIPFGSLTYLLRKDLRQFLTALDLYCALLLAVPAAYLRWTGQLPPGALVPLTGLVIVILSTMPLTLFGLDGEGGLARYELLPVRAWQVLAAKGMAYLILVVLVTALLSPLGGLAGGLVSLAIGQRAAVQQVILQSRWRFRTSSPFAFSLIQMFLSLLAFATVTTQGALWLVPCIAAYGFSLWRCDRALHTSEARP